MRAARRAVAALLGLVLVAVTALVGEVAAPTPASASAPLGSVSNYGLGVRDPYAIVAGPDGNLWFTNRNNNSIGRVTPAGVVTTFTDPSVKDPRGIAAGADGNLWFANNGNDSIGRITTAGVISQYTDAPANPGDPTIKAPTGITAGPDGNLWFTNTGGTSVGRITPAGVITYFSDVLLSGPRAIVAGPDGNLWFTSDPIDEIWRLTPAGVFTQFVDATLSNPRQLAAGPDGNVWFTYSSGVDPQAPVEGVGKVTPTGVVTAYTDPSIHGPRGIVAGPDGNLWFVNETTSTIGQVTPTGVVNSFTAPTVSGPQGITAGPDGGVWFTNRTNDSIGRIDPATHVITQAVGNGVAGPDGITAGPDGNVWFANFDGGSIGRITPAGVTTLFADPGIVTPTGITAGPDGNLWFTMLFANAIGRITPAGAVTIFRDATIGGPSGITPGPDGNLWFTNAFNNSIGRITPLGVVTRYVGTGGIFLPTSITTGADGGLWFTNRSTDSIGRIDPSTFVVDILTGTGIAGPQSIVSGPDGSLWFTNATGSSIGRLTVNPAKTGTVCNGPLTRCTVTTTTDPSIKNPYGLTVGPDANLWFTNQGGDSVGTISPTGVVSSYTGPGTVAPRGIAAGPDGNVWFTNGNSSIGSVGAGPAPAGLAFHPMAPQRILDSRTATGGWNGKLQAGTPRSLPVAGVNGVPADAGAVVVNVTATEADIPSFLTVYPSGGTVPNASNLNFAAGQTIPNLVTVKVGTGGNVSFANANGAVNVVADIVGYFDGSAGSRNNALEPVRILDSRGPTGGWGSELVAGTPRSLTVTGVGGVPNSATAVVVNVTATDGSAPSFLTLYPSGGSTPLASNVNFAAGQTIPNLAIVQVGAGGKIDIANAIGSVDVVVDVVSYFDAASGDYFHPMYPTRVLDSRGANGGWNGPLVAGTPRSLPVASHRGIPAAAHAVVGNATVTNGTLPSFLTVYPGGPTVPNVSNLNFAAGQTIPNHVLVKVGGAGTTSFAHAAGSVDVVFDVVGYYAGS